MAQDVISTEDLTKLMETLGETVKQSRSFEELETFFKSQHYVKSVKATDYLIKTNPPKKELQVTFKLNNGSSITKMIDITLYPDKSIGLASIHEQSK